MTKLDKVLFAFAAYNAGPGRVAQLRREAARRGLDPNVWFHNVEYIAEERIGHETVTYVSNIFKYYIAYRLIEEALQERQEARRTSTATRSLGHAVRCGPGCGSPLRSQTSRVRIGAGAPIPFKPSG